MELNTMLFLVYISHKADIFREYGYDIEPWTYQEFLEHSRVAAMLREDPSMFQFVPN